MKADRNLPLPEGETMTRLFWNAVELRGDLVALRQKEFGIWRAVSWREFGDIAREIGMGLVALGFEAGERASILSNNVKEWAFADFAILGAAGVSAGIYPTDSAAQVEYLLRDCAARYLFVEDEEQLDKALSVRERCPDLRKIIVFDMEDLYDFEDPDVLSLDDLRALGREAAARHPEEWLRRIDLRRAEDLAILVYTSGTTGPPKGAMLSHRNLVCQCVEGIKILPQHLGDERISFLPLCHVAERIGGLYMAVYSGAISNFVENPETVPENIREVQPTFFGAVPRIWEKFYSAINIALQDATPFERWAYRTALGFGRRVADLELEGRSVPMGLRILNAIGYALVLKNVRRMMGLGRCRWAFTGAAPISPELVRWYLSLGLPMLEVYGQTENAGLATYTPIGGVRLGKVGISVPYGEVRISDEGEILLRGDHVFMGYLNQPEKTAETLAGGWLHTGDVGFIDNEGYVKITDRMKDIIITAGGKNITPSEIENELKFSPFISDAVVIGDGRKYLTCLVMIDHDNVVKFAQDRNVPFTNYASLCRAREVQDLIWREIEKVNANFARVETIKKFRLIEQELTAEDDELTPTMKLKRKFVNEKYRDLIEEMYS